MIIPGKLDRETNHDFALRVLQENIVSLELKPGSMLSEQELATQLSLSRTPVHEALLELANTKIVEVIPQRGSLVSLIDMALVEESCFIRSAIEGAVTEQACQKATAEDVESLEETVVLQEFYFGKQNLEKFMEFDNKFHQTMYKITGRMLCYYTVLNGCPLGAALRRKFKRTKRFPKKKFLCVYSDELLDNQAVVVDEEVSSFYQKAQVNGTIAHITAIFGFTLAGLVIQDLCRS